MVPEVLAAIGARPPRAHLVVLSDFDGTLASFDVDPTAFSEVGGIGDREQQPEREGIRRLAVRRLHGDVAR